MTVQSSQTDKQTNKTHSKSHMSAFTCTPPTWDSVLYGDQHRADALAASVTWKLAELYAEQVDAFGAKWLKSIVVLEKLIQGNQLDVDQLLQATAKRTNNASSLCLRYSLRRRPVRLRRHSASSLSSTLGGMVVNLYGAGKWRVLLGRERCARLST